MLRFTIIKVCKRCFVTFCKPSNNVTLATNKYAANSFCLLYMTVIATSPAFLVITCT